ncbi:hypothetical protein TNCV_2772671 [Trichonephila clavipes]|nr:hypothetical protein TNCV_2772671 [Trichonephila clavipes]
MRKIIRTVFCHCFVGGLFAKKNNDQLRYLLRHSTEAPKIIAKQTSGTCCQKVFCSYTITPDLAPKDFHLFRYLKRSLGGKRFSDYEEKKVAVNSWLSDKAAEFFDEGFQNLALSPPIDTSVWNGATQEETELQWNGTGWSLATNPDSIPSSDNNHVRVWRPRVERLNPAFALQQHTAPIAGVMEPFFNKTMFGLIRQRCHKTLHTVTLLRFSARSEHIWNHLGVQVGHPTSLNELDVNMERNVSRHQTELVCLNA